MLPSTSEMITVSLRDPSDFISQLGNLINTVLRLIYLMLIFFIRATSAQLNGYPKHLMAGVMEIELANSYLVVSH